MKIPFVGGSATQRSVSLDAQRTVNLYPVMDAEGKAPIALYGTPGLVQFATTHAAEVRGMHEAGGRLFAVVGNVFYEIASNGTATNRGTLLTSTGPVSIADNGLQVVAVDGTYGYSFVLATNAFAQITDIDWPAANRIAFQDGYLIVGDSGTGSFFITSLYGTDIDALDFASAEGAPDPLISLICDHRELWLFGDESTEVWFNSGNVDFPFERINGAFLETGCAAPQSVAKLDNSVFWLTKDKRGQGQIVRAQGYQPQIVSTRALEYAIANYSTIDDAIAYTYTQEGVGFYVITFPTAGKTWAMDVASGLWHERSYWNAGTEERHRGNCYAFCFGRHLVGDYANGKIYELSLDAYTDDGAPLRALRRTRHQHAEGKRLFWSSLQIDIEAGVGLTTGQGSDPQMMLRWSDDGGKTWSNEHWHSMGKIGEYSRRAIWRRLGASYNRVYEVVIADPVKRVIIDAWAEAEVGR